jgi:dUTPase
MDFFQLMGWKIVGTIDSDIKKCVMMIMPHTSAHDFFWVFSLELSLG